MARNRRDPHPAPSRVRCAIYTRKSSEEGLEQSFNSLDAQREACEAYIASQVGEGWTALASRYDDGGYSGGSMERPGLQRLLCDIELRKVHVVVVYKVDRLTRSLADFARIVDAFDSNGVSFVSVTQAFNTTTSMGRLTLNVLLSFAQFEREVTGERIRDKIAASKKKGMWMGGTPPLGYRPHERTLVIDEAEAETVRHIFSRYLELGSVHELKRELDRAGICSRPSRKTAAPAPFGRGALYHLLSNRIYVGEIVHKNEAYQGQHEALIEPVVFGHVQQLLAKIRTRRSEQNITAGRAPLAGLIFDAEGQPLSPVSSRKQTGQIYRYYVSATLQRGGRVSGASVRRVPAPAIEQVIMDELQALAPIQTWDGVRRHLARIEVHQGRLLLRVKGSIEAPRSDDYREIEVPWVLREWRGRAAAALPVNARRNAGARIDHTLIRALTRAHSILRQIRSIPGATIETVAKQEGVTAAYIRRLIRMAFLAPDIQEAILQGRQTVRTSLEHLMRVRLPLGWRRQHLHLGTDGAKSS